MNRPRSGYRSAAGVVIVSWSAMSPNKEPTMAPDFPPVPETVPQPVAPDTWLVPNLAAVGPDLYVPVNSMVIRGEEPIIVDTGAPVHHDRWIEHVFSIVDPGDVRWIFLSHDDSDHTGGLMDALELCPNATLVTNFFSVDRLALENKGAPLERMRWIEPGDSFEAGDRTLVLFRPPIFDGPTTRGLYDTKTATMWAADSFACFTPGAIFDVHDIPREIVEETMPAVNSLVSPWHQWLDKGVYRAHVDEVEALGVLAVASAHGPILTGGAIHEAFDLVRDLAAKPIIPSPGQELLDELVAAALAGQAA
jgi:flavorubredoxin